MTSPTPAIKEPFDFGRALRFFFEDPNWVNKILVGSLFTVLTLLVVGWFFVAGYMVRILRRTANGEEHPLPEWEDFGGLFTDGIRLVAVNLGYMIPLGLLVTLLGLAAAGVAASSQDAPDALRLVAGATMLAGYLLFTVAGLALCLYLPAAILRFATKDSVAAAFDVRENWAFVKRNAANYGLALVTFLVVSFVAQFGIILFCVGIFPATFWSTAVYGYALGEVARRDTAPETVPPATAAPGKAPPAPRDDGPKGDGPQGSGSKGASYTEFLP